MAAVPKRGRRVLGELVEKNHKNGGESFAPVSIDRHSDGLYNIAELKRNG